MAWDVSTRPEDGTEEALMAGYLRFHAACASLAQTVVWTLNYRLVATATTAQF